MIGLRPFTTSYFAHRGNCYLKKGENEKAISDFKYAASKGDRMRKEFPQGSRKGLNDKNNANS